MTDRERWTVYPLLFLALGISLKDKLGQSIDTDRIECKTLICEGLEVAGPEPGQRVTITQGNLVAKGSILSEGLEVSGPKPGQRVTVTQGNILCRTLIASDETGTKQLAVVSSNQDGGILRTFGTHTGTHAVLGNFNQYAGLLFVDARGAAHAGPMYGSPVPLKKPEEQTQPVEQPGPEQPNADESAEQPNDAQAPPAETTGTPNERAAESADQKSAEPATTEASAAQP